MWHQGENDCNPSGVNSYNSKLSVIMDTLRHELNLDDVPLIVGGLGDYLPYGKLFGKYFCNAPDISHAIFEFSQKTPNCYFVTASGLTPNPDGIHINAKSQRLFGIRYYKAFCQRKHILSPLHDEEEILTWLHKQPLTDVAVREILGMKFSSGKISLEEYQMKIKGLV